MRKNRNDLECVGSKLLKSDRSLETRLQEFVPIEVTSATRKIYSGNATEPVVASQLPAQ